jgi:histidinol phosphatase-like PHP family hydrolase
VAGIGITDHLFLTPSSRQVANPRDFERVFAAEARQYVDEVLAARQRWEGKLQIFCGCEINWPLNRMHMDLIRQYLRGIDYVLFEYVDWSGLTQLANQARRWPCPVGLAHTDVAGQYPSTSMDQVVRTMANARIFYEINTKLLPLSQHERWFALLPKHRLYVSFGTDTHDDLSCLRELPKMVDYARQHGLADKFYLPRVMRESTVTNPQA